MKRGDRDYPSDRPVLAHGERIISAWPFSKERGADSEADFLHHEIASEAVCRLHDNRADAVAGDARQQGGEARACLDRIGAAHRRRRRRLGNRIRLGGILPK